MLPSPTLDLPGGAHLVNKHMSRLWNEIWPKIYHLKFDVYKHNTWFVYFLGFMQFISSHHLFYEKGIINNMNINVGIYGNFVYNNNQRAYVHDMWTDRQNKDIPIQATTIKQYDNREKVIAIWVNCFTTNVP